MNVDGVREDALNPNIGQDPCLASFQVLSLSPQVGLDHSPQKHKKT